ncbi:MAG TPA: hypothetical protein VH298_02525 [Jatrophihabitans sp.]|jgi:hypothetical protein|nr:hypothetical protein [Jatrophihabitans sp.]
MGFFIVVGVLVLTGVIWGLVTRKQPTYPTDALRELGPDLKRHIDGQYMRGDGGHRNEDFEYGGDKAEWD